ncbi:HEXXH motif-containing putative peptide modification protein [Lentzea sp. NPDC058450]|uniref:aKG-HExxH-type peptide beta-hydroxylase n=1 Tax=Lentzea sp. NPDC058450 TaxID=3346505 RepID=UPI003663BF63
MLGSPSAPALHAQLAPADVLVDERRALYRLAVDLFAPGTELSDNLLDHPITRYEIGRALSGHGDLDPGQLREVSAMGVRDLGLLVASDPAAADQLEAPLRIVAPDGAKPEPLTEADGARFEAAAGIVADGVALLRKLAPAMASDLLAHVSMLAVLRSETSGGVVSASSRYVPGIVLIDEPTTPMEVAEALVHEGAHEKFFDFAITREFLDVHAEDAEYFENSWSHARWPLEQTFAAWHAYSCLAQFAVVAEGERLGPHSLLPKARERATEIGEWLLAHEFVLLPHARWLLHAFSGDAAVPGPEDSAVDGVRTVPEGSCFEVRSGVAHRVAGTGRVVAGRLAGRPEIYWLDADPGWLMRQFRGSALSFEMMLSRATEEWQVGSAVARDRVGSALGSLVRESIVEYVQMGNR